MTERLRLFIGKSKFNNLDALPANLRQASQAELERSGQLMGRIATVYKDMPRRGLLRPQTSDEILKDQERRLSDHERFMAALRAYEAAFLRTAGKTVLAEQAANAAIDYLRGLEAMLKERGGTASELALAQVSAERERLETFKENVIEKAKEKLFGEPQPEEEELLEIEEEIDEEIAKNSILNRFYSFLYERALPGFTGFFAALFEQNGINKPPKNVVPPPPEPPPSPEPWEVEQKEEERKQKIKEFIKKWAERHVPIAPTSTASETEEETEKAEAEPAPDLHDE